MTTIEIGRLLRAAIPGFVVGCRVNRLDSPTFGGLVNVPLADGYAIYGLIYDIRIDDDGLVRQLVTIDAADAGSFEAVIADNRLNRNVPIEMSVLAVGYQRNGQVYHLLPPRPPLSLDQIFLCEPDEVVRFTSTGRFGYFRHILRATDLPVSELLAAHLQQAGQAHRIEGDSDWVNQAVQELIVLLRDDYQTLMSVLSALSDVVGEF
jgi:hypothetical protein